MHCDALDKIHSMFFLAKMIVRDQLRVDYNSTCKGDRVLMSPHV